MPDPYEQLYRELDARYGADRRRITLARVTGAVDVTNYSITFEDASGNPLGDPIPGIKAILRPPVPIVGDLVRVELSDGDPLILEVMGRGPVREQNLTSGQATTGSSTYVVAGVGSDIVAHDLVAGQIVTVHISAKMGHSLDTGHGAVMSFKVTGAFTYGPNDDDGLEQDNIGGATCAKDTDVVVPAGGTGTATFTLVYRAINGATANFFQRRIKISE